MKNNNSDLRLGRIPKGLEWLAQETIAEQKNEVVLEEVKVQSGENIIVRQDEQKVLEKEKVEPEKIEESKTIKQGLSKGWTRATFIVKEENLSMLKAISYWDAIPLKDLVDQALFNYLQTKDLKEYKRHKRNLKS